MSDQHVRRGDDPVNRGRFSPGPRPEPQVTLGAGRWRPGEAEIEQMLARGELERVQPNREHAEGLMDRARRNLASVDLLVEDNPEAAFTVAYDAARYALTAHLANQGLRVRGGGEGGHLNLGRAAIAQIGRERVGMFDALRRVRNDTAYPSPDRQVAGGDDAVDARRGAAVIVEACGSLLDVVPPWR